MKIKLTLILIFSLCTTLSYAEELGNLSPEQLIAMQKNNNALVIDIRTQKEWDATGTIPDSHKLQFFSDEGKYDTEKWLSELNQLKTSADQPVILVCRSGGRSGMLGNLLTQQKGMKHIYQLSNGIMQWIKAGNEISKGCPTELACK